jgi:roundabout, axon guidance receptor 2
VKARKNFSRKENNFFFHLFTQIINGRYVEGFYIYARNIDDNEQPSYKMLTVLQNAGSGASSCKISGLQKFTTYEFFVVPFYKAVEGKPSNSRIARTLEDGEFTLNYTWNFA